MRSDFRRKMQRQRKPRERKKSRALPGTIHKNPRVQAVLREAPTTDHPAAVPRRATATIVSS
jgi:hypothetical protein